MTKIFVTSGKSIAVGLRPFNCLFTLRIWRQYFLWINLTIVWSLSFRRWEALMSRSYIFTPIFWNTWQIFYWRTLSLTNIGIPTTSSVSLLEYWAFFQHWPSVTTTLSTNLLFFFLTIATSTSNFLEWACKSLTSVVSLLICGPKLASVFKIICTSSGLLSLLRIAPVWAQPYSCTCYNNKEKYVTYKTAWLTFFK